MKRLCYLAATAALLVAAPVVIGPASAQQFSGSGATNIWSSAQGTSFSWGNAGGTASTTVGTIGIGGGGGLSGAGALGGALTSSMSTSTVGVSSYGSGYAQTQTSGYAGGSVSGYGGVHMH